MDASPKDTKSTCSKGKNRPAGLPQTSVRLRKQPAECKDSLLGGRKYLQTRLLKRSCRPEYSHGSPLLGLSTEEMLRLVGAGQGAVSRQAGRLQIGWESQAQDHPEPRTHLPEGYRLRSRTVGSAWPPSQPPTPHPCAPSLLSVPFTSGWHDQPGEPVGPVTGEAPRSQTSGCSPSALIIPAQSLVPSSVQLWGLVFIKTQLRPYPALLMLSCSFPISS